MNNLAMVASQQCLTDRVLNLRLVNHNTPDALLMSPDHLLSRDQLKYAVYVPAMEAYYRRIAPTSSSPTARSLKLLLQFETIYHLSLIHI